MEITEIGPIVSLAPRRITEPLPNCFSKLRECGLYRPCYGHLLPRCVSLSVCRYRSRV